MTKDEALKLALEALEKNDHRFELDRYENDGPTRSVGKIAITAIREALAEQPAQQECNHCGGTGDVSGEYPGVACPECGGSGVQAQPEFIKHEVENAYDWSEWVCPDPESYLMKCCDCGLVHEAQFRVAKYKPAPSDECEVVSDPDLQAQFRMRRSEQWSPEDTAHRAGGLPMAEQPEYASEADTEELLKLNELPEPLRLAAMLEKTMQWPLHGKAADCLRKMHAELEQLAQPEQEPVATMWQHGGTGRTRITTPDSITDCDAQWFKVSDLYTAPSRRRKPLTVEELIPLAVVLFVIDEKDLDGMYVSNLSRLQDELRQKLISAMCEKNSRLVNFARAIEAAHGIKD